MRVTYDTWRNRNTGKVLSLEEVIEVYGNRLGLPPSKRNETHAKPEWLMNLEDIKVKFIDTQRTVRSMRASEEDESSVKILSTVSVYSRNLAKRIQSTLAEYASRSQLLDSSFPKRLVKRLDRNSDLDENEMETKYEENNQKRSLLFDVGLLEEDEKGINFQELKKLEDTNRDVL